MITFTQIMRFGTPEFKELANKMATSYAKVWNVTETKAKKVIARDLVKIYAKTSFQVQKHLADLETNMALNVL